MSTALMHELPKGARFRFHGETYLVKVAASENPSGFVHVWDLSMTDREVAEQFEAARQAGHHPREGFFAFSFPTEVEVLP